MATHSQAKKKSSVLYNKKRTVINTSFNQSSLNITSKYRRKLQNLLQLNRALARSEAQLREDLQTLEIKHETLRKQLLFALDPTKMKLQLDEVSNILLRAVQELCTAESMCNVTSSFVNGSNSQNRNKALCANDQNRPANENTVPKTFLPMPQRTVTMTRNGDLPCIEESEGEVEKPTMDITPLDLPALLFIANEVGKENMIPESPELHQLKDSRSLKRVSSLPLVDIVKASGSEMVKPTLSTCQEADGDSVASTSEGVASNNKRINTMPTFFFLPSSAKKSTKTAPKRTFAQTLPNKKVVHIGSKSNVASENAGKEISTGSEAQIFKNGASKETSVQAVVGPVNEEILIKVPDSVTPAVANCSEKLETERIIHHCVDLSEILSNDLDLTTYNNSEMELTNVSGIGKVAQQDLNRAMVENSEETEKHLKDEQEIDMADGSIESTAKKSHRLTVHFQVGSNLSHVENIPVQEAAVNIQPQLEDVLASNGGDDVQSPVKKSRRGRPMKSIKKNGYADEDSDYTPRVKKTKTKEKNFEFFDTKSKKTAPKKRLVSTKKAKGSGAKQTSKVDQALKDIFDLSNSMNKSSFIKPYSPRPKSAVNSKLVSQTLNTSVSKSSEDSDKTLTPEKPQKLSVHKTNVGKNSTGKFQNKRVKEVASNDSDEEILPVRRARNRILSDNMSEDTTTPATVIQKPSKAKVPENTKGSTKKPSLEDDIATDNMETPMTSNFNMANAKKKLNLTKTSKSTTEKKSLPPSRESIPFENAQPKQLRLSEISLGPTPTTSSGRPRRGEAKSYKLPTLNKKMRRD